MADQPRIVRWLPLIGAAATAGAVWTGLHGIWSVSLAFGAVVAWVQCVIWSGVRRAVKWRCSIAGCPVRPTRKVRMLGRLGPVMFLCPDHHHAALHVQADLGVPLHSDREVR